MKIANFVKTISIACLSIIPTLGNAGVGEGQELYDAYCQICHGGLGEGHHQQLRLFRTRLQPQ